MTKEEVAKLLILVNTAYPNFKVENKAETINAWHWILDDCDANEIMVAFKTYTRTDKSGFAPSISQLITMTHKTDELTEIDDAGAWAMVRKAISNGIYKAEEEFAKFPPEVQQAVGAPSQLTIWAQDSEFNEGVESSNFKRALRTVKERNREINYLPPEARAILEAKMKNPLIGVINND